VFGAAGFVNEAAHPDVNWGYGPPNYIAPAQVAAAAAQLAGLTEQDLIEGVDPAELTEAELYPMIDWTDPDELRLPTQYLGEAKRFFADAANADDAVICWVS
jgi:hypothetical protein